MLEGLVDLVLYLFVVEVMDVKQGSAVTWVPEVVGQSTAESGSAGAVDAVDGEGIGRSILSETSRTLVD